MATCPFSSGIDSNGCPVLSPCVNSCELKIKDQCAFAVIAKELLQKKSDIKTETSPKG